MNVRVKSLLGACVVLLMVSGGAAPAAEKKEKVDLNTASMSELESLPGVGPAIAKRIVDNRPYSSVAGLSKAGVPDATVSKLKGNGHRQPGALGGGEVGAGRENRTPGARAFGTEVCRAAGLPGRQDRRELGFDEGSRVPARSRPRDC